ncbi:MAG TPA: hypothetical protein VHA13_00985, partial [Gammaproteobacteria bacterium]|nr:hypothetical protein [Gammaproteobacteria bacterium]
MRDIKEAIQDSKRDVDQLFDGMLDDLMDTFDAYPKEAPSSMKRENWQPIIGAENAVLGAMTLVILGGIAMPLYFFINLLMTPRYLTRWESLKEHLEFIANLLFSWPLTLLEGCAGILRGLTQIAATPLTWLIKKPLRYFLTWVRDKWNLKNISIFNIKKAAIFSSYSGWDNRAHDYRRNIQQLGEIRNLAQYGFSFFSNMLRDAWNTLMPYSIDQNLAARDKKLEWLQPWRGLRNIYIGILGLVAVPFQTLRDLYLNLFYSESFLDMLRNVTLSLLLPPLRLLNCAGHLVRGITEIAATPLTWLVKKPLRYAWTGVRSFFDNRGKAERRSSIQYLIDHDIQNALNQVNEDRNKLEAKEYPSSDKALNSVVNIFRDIQAIKNGVGILADKYQKAVNLRHQSTNIDQVSLDKSQSAFNQKYNEFFDKEYAELYEEAQQQGK